MSIHFSILAWKIPWTEEPSGLQSMGSQRLGHDWADELTCMPTNWSKRKKKREKKLYIRRGKRWQSLFSFCLLSVSQEGSHTRKPCLPLILEFPASRTVRNKTLRKSGSSWYFSWQPAQAGIAISNVSLYLKNSKWLLILRSDQRQFGLSSLSGSFGKYLSSLIVSVSCSHGWYYDERNSLT